MSLTLLGHGPVTLLALSLLGLALGPAVHIFGGRWRWLVTTFDGLVLVALGGLLVGHILPELLRVLGPWALAAAAAGLLAPPVFERLLSRSARHIHLLTLGVALLGLALHGAADGVALAGPPGLHAGHAHADVHDHLGVAVVLHRLPVGLTVWWLLRPVQGVRAAAGVMALIAGATIAGFCTAGLWHEALQGPGLATFQAFVVGSLMHVVLHRPHGPACDHDHGPAEGAEQARQATGAGGSGGPTGG